MLAAAGLVENELPFPNVVFGVIALVALLLLLAITMAIGKGRPDRT